MNTRASAIATVAMALLLSADARAQVLADDVDALTEGVRTIASPGTPGALATWGPAFPVICGTVERDLAAPVVAASRLGKGRIVTLAHSGYGDAATMAIADTGRLMRNAIRWAAGEGDGGVTVGVHAGPLGEWLAAEGHTVVRLDGPHWTRQLDRAQVTCLFTSSLTDADMRDLDAYIRAGGGLVAAQTGWGWQQLNAHPPMRTNALNRLLAPAGLGWTDDTIGDTADDAFVVQRPPALARGAAALDLLLGDPPQGAPPPPDKSLRQAAATAMRSIRLLPDDDQAVRPVLAALLERDGAGLVPTKAAPLGKRDARRRFLLAYQLEMLEHRSPGQVAAHPSATVFPGAVDPAASRVTRTIAINPRVHGRHSLALYAPAGEIMRLTIPAHAVAAGLKVRIGAHSDELWHHERWDRAPAICRVVNLGAPTTTVASAFGGLVYVEVPARCRLEALSVTVEGCVEAPLFVLGQTTAQEWRDAIRARPGPWAELATSKVVLTVPSSEIRALDDPEPLMQFWDQVLDAAADLAAIPRERPRPERYVADVQISAGYMHSGYPIMTHLDAASHMVSLERMRGGAWGLYHELGHNHQEREWTFEGTGEVTCNLFSLYISRELCRITDAEAHEALRDPMRYVGPYLASGAKFPQWKANPFLAFHMYRQMIDAFGWETFKRVFAEYRELKPAQRPKGEEQERDQWLVRFSRACGRNLGPFFQAWGVPTSDAARASIADLPGWMPEGFPPP